MSDEKDGSEMLVALAAAARAIDACEPSKRRRVMDALSALFLDHEPEPAAESAPSRWRSCADCGARLYGFGFGLGHVRCLACNKKYSLRTSDFSEWRLNETRQPPPTADEPGDG